MGPSIVKTKLILVSGTVALVAFALWQWEWDASGVELWMSVHAWLGAVLYVVLLAGSVVLLPLSSLPLLPLAAKIYGVVPTALLSVAGWWIGSLIAFELARLGRHQLERITSMAAVDRLEEQIPHDVGFWGIVVLRMILPTDLVSFALGLLKHLSFRTYAVATLLGILPFSFVWSYAGGEISAGRFLPFMLTAVGMIAAIFAIRRIWRTHHARMQAAAHDAN